MRAPPSSTRIGSRVPPPCGTSTAPRRPDKDGAKQVFSCRRSPRVGSASCYYSSSVRSGRVYRVAADAGRDRRNDPESVGAHACGTLRARRAGRAGRAPHSAFARAYACDFLPHARQPFSGPTTNLMTTRTTDIFDYSSTSLNFKLFGLSHERLDESMTQSLLLSSLCA
ncbi:hypothetical protein QTP88_012206 [Uroleucon formosanum]